MAAVVGSVGRRIEMFVFRRMQGNEKVADGRREGRSGKKITKAKARNVRKPSRAGDQ